jgi:hypothetical protein
MSDKLFKGTLTPAHGRDYKSAKDAIADFNAGKDFVLNTHLGSTYCSKTDFAPGANLVIRYKRNTKLCTYYIEKE